MAYRTTSWKNTDIGYIPSDWSVKKLHELCDYSKESIGFKQLTTLNFVGVDNLLQNCKGKEKSNFIPTFGNYPKYVKGDILISNIRPYLKKIWLAKYEGGSSPDVLVLHKKTELNDQFLYYNLANDKFFEYEMQNTKGIKMPRGDKDWIMNYDVLYPDVPEQQKIAEVLTDLDDLIAELENVRDKKQAIKIGAMQELLTGKRRLPGFNKPWKEVELGELLTYEQPQNYIVRSEEYRKTGTPVLTAGKTFVLGYTDEIDNIFSSVPVIIFDDFTTVSKFVNFPFKVKSSAIKILKLKNIEDNLKFIFEVMQITPFNLLNHQRYWISKYSKMSIKVPEYIEQTTIANILSDMDDEISAINDKINKYKQIKAGVADELLSGRIRLIKPQE